MYLIASKMMSNFDTRFFLLKGRQVSGVGLARRVAAVGHSPDVREDGLEPLELGLRIFLLSVDLLRQVASFFRVSTQRDGVQVGSGAEVRGRGGLGRVGLGFHVGHRSCNHHGLERY
jgi:hypothetical protein